MKKLVIKYKPGCAGEPIALIIERIRHGAPLPHVDPLNRYNNETPRISNGAYYRAKQFGLYDRFVDYGSLDSGVFLCHGMWLSTIANLYKNGFAFLYEIVDNTNSDCKKLFGKKVDYDSESLEKFFTSYEEEVVPEFYTNPIVNDYEKKAFKLAKVSYQDIFEEEDGYKIIEEMGDIKLTKEWIDWYKMYCDRNKEMISE